MILRKIPQYSYLTTLSKKNIIYFYISAPSTICIAMYWAPSTICIAYWSKLALVVSNCHYLNYLIYLICLQNTDTTENNNSFE